MDSFILLGQAAFWILLLGCASLDMMLTHCQSCIYEMGDGGLLVHFAVRGVQVEYTLTPGDDGGWRIAEALVLGS